MGCFSGKTKDEHDAQNGPHKRHCTDFFFLILFALFWVGMVIVAIQASKLGNPYRLVYGNDYEGNTCGVNNEPYQGRDLSGKPLVYYIVYPTLSYIPICVDKCPDETHLLPTSDDEVICPYYTSQSIFHVFPAGRCMGTYSSIPVLYRCIPSNAINMTESATSQIYDDLNLQQAKDISYRILSDLVRAWKYILSFSFFSLVLAFIWLFLLRLLAGFMVWTTILLVLGALIACSFILWKQSQTLQNDINQLPPDQRLESEQNNIKVLHGLAWGIGALTVVLALIILAMVNRINLAIQIVREASRAIASMPSIMFFPVITFLMLLGLAAYWIGISALLGTSANIHLSHSNVTVGTDFFNVTTFSNGTIIEHDQVDLDLDYYYYYLEQEQLDNSNNATLNDTFGNNTFANITTNSTNLFGEFEALFLEPANNIRYLQLYHLFGGFWTLNFIIAIGHCTIAGAISTWYWTHDKRQVPYFVVWTAFYNTVRYHLGSLAFGSLILAIIQFIRYLLSQVEKKFRAKQARLIKVAAAILQCFLAYFERFIKFLNKNAYIMVAMYGYSFCGGARRAFGLILKNILRVAAINWVSSFLTFLSKLFICAVTTIASFLVIRMDKTISFYAIPVILIAIISYAVATGFFAVYDMAIDTILLCFCEDSDKNDGSAEKPYFMSEGLGKFVNHADHDRGCCEKSHIDDEPAHDSNGSTNKIENKS
eukprot:TRINITY_DN183_c0_g1_i1.p1 TRINITY_DN183_c0_g1~~TRINITY_DN183_c0_g1_i1.p1  ORF type:complete len:709 (+),score=136.87 TRINITY_DN183_c0_g1_i1:277-2403(+)